MLRFTHSLTASFAALSLATSAEALEKKSVPFNDDGSGDWIASGAPCNINYYNTCTGWVWCWSGFADGDRFGVVNHTPCGPDVALLNSTHFICTPAPAGYGFTGTIAAYAVDANDCPTGAPIVSQPFLPSHTSPPFHVVQWNVALVPDDFALIVVTAGDGNPAAFGTDHPAAGPTGPAACGTCYSPNRPTHSFYYSTIENPACPGSVFNDGVCNAELLWDLGIIYAPLSTDQASWGSIKALYR